MHSIHRFPSCCMRFFSSGIPAAWCQVRETTSIFQCEDPLGLIRATGGAEAPCQYCTDPMLSVEMLGAEDGELGVERRNINCLVNIEMLFEPRLIAFLFRSTQRLANLVQGPPGYAHLRVSSRPNLSVFLSAKRTPCLQPSPSTSARLLHPRPRANVTSSRFQNDLEDRIAERS